MPEFTAEPDGSVSLDWIVAKYRLFSVGVGAENRIAYAWLDGSEKGHAVANFDGMTIPAKVRDGIESIIGHANDTIRVA